MDSTPINNNLYLPIAEKTILRLVSERLVEGELHQKLATYEIASLLILNHLADEAEPNQLLEKNLANIISMGNEYRNSDKLFIDVVASKININEISRLLSRLDELDVFLMPEGDIAKETFLQIDGNWSFEFKTNYTHPTEDEVYVHETPLGVKHAYRSEQYRVLNEMLRNISDEHIQIEAVAGSGKTMMLGPLAEELFHKYHGARKRIVAMARRREQVEVMGRLLPSEISLWTFGWYAEALIRSNNPDGMVLEKNLSDRKRMPWNYDVVATEFLLKPIGNYSPQTVARIIVQIIAFYCNSVDEYISDQHIPKWVEMLRPDQQAVLVLHANMLWEIIKKPPFKLPLRDGHLIKFAALNKLLPARNVAHIIIDESHDLSPAMLELISNGHHAITGLGDKFQSIYYTPPKPKYAIERTLSDSFRVPRGYDRLINTLLHRHPLGRDASFNGNRERKTLIEYYDDYPDLINLDDHVAIFVNDDWELFEYLHRLEGINRKYVLIGGGNQLKQIEEFVKGCIGLFSSNTSSSHVLLGKYRSWSQLQYVLRDNRAFNYILQVLDNGYDLEDWEKTSSLDNPYAKTVIGLYDQAKSMEYPSIMLAPDIIDTFEEMLGHGASNSRQAKSAHRELSSKLYLGTTRTTAKIIAPRKFEYFLKV